MKAIQDTDFNKLIVIPMPVRLNIDFRNRLIIYFEKSFYLRIPIKH